MLPIPIWMVALGLWRRTSHLLLFMIFAPLCPARADWLELFSHELKETRMRIQQTQAELAILAEPMLGNTVPELGLQHRMMEQPPPAPPFVQVDLGSSELIDSVVLIPALVEFQTVRQSPYSFPLRFRLDASDTANFSSFTPLLVRTDVDHVQQTLAPLIIPTPGLRARYLRFTVIKLAQVEKRWTFALSELMALQGARNIALGAQVTHAATAALRPRWLPGNLTDGRTPLGPPIDRSSVPEFDALFVSQENAATPIWMGLDLGKSLPIDEIRVHPLHARQGADVPGYAFPSRFRVEISHEEDMQHALKLFDTGEDAFPNPGNNPVTFKTPGATGRYIRFTMLQPYTPNQKSFALSEMEAYSGNLNVARSAKVISSGDPLRDVPRPLSLLNDGHTSYGRLIALPEWFNTWSARERLQSLLAQHEVQLAPLLAQAQQRALWAGALSVSLLLATTAGMFWRSRRQHERAQQLLRSQLARDMHDDIGSNLAGISVISETAALMGDSTAEDWREIHRIALVGARQESGIHLMEQMQRVAKRLLPSHDVHWSHLPSELPAAWPTEAQREVFLFFKEALTNIIRHAHATRVDLSAQITASTFELNIQDDGTGFDVTTPDSGMGLNSLRARATALRGTLALRSSPAEGTHLRLQVPLP
jgi:signal transduction histidine kinase